jgi:hypothetical protein
VISTRPGNIIASLICRFTVLAAVVAMMAATPGSALASSTADAYAHQGGAIVNVHAPAPGQGLPFTGLDVALIVAGGVGLIGLGVVIRRTSDWLG